MLHHELCAVTPLFIIGIVEFDLYVNHGELQLKAIDFTDHLKEYV